MELVRTFLAVARAGGMRRAAASLHRTQPAISARIRDLERDVGAPLFERLGRQLQLTAAGRLLASEGPGLLASGEELRRRVEAMGASERGSLRLATIDAASIYVLPQLYLQFRRDYPEVRLTVQVVDSRRVLAAVHELEADLGVLALPASHPEVETVPIFEDRMICIAAPGHPLAARPSVPLAAVAAQPLVLYGRGSVTRASIDRVFQARGLEPQVAMETASPEAMKHLAEAGVGLAIVPLELARSEIAAGRLCEVRVRDARFQRQLASAVRRGRELPPAARQFLARLYREHPPLGAPRSTRGRGAAHKHEAHRSR